MKDLTVDPNIPIREAMKALDKTAENCLLVVDENNKLLGTLTDGDLRRSILKGKKFSSNISSIYNKNPSMLVDGKFTKKESEMLMRDKKLGLIPIVDETMKVVNYETWSSAKGGIPLQKTLDNVPVVIMAGGKGTRLEPFTKILPKPLIPVNDKPIIEHIIEQFTEVGCKEFHMTLNYKGKILKAYFDELLHDYKIYFYEENEPLGTAGSLSFMYGMFDKPFFITNCDIIIKADFARLYEFHQENEYDITLVVCAKEYVIPYGACEMDKDGQLSHINEKPKYEFLFNTGFYILNPDILNLIPKNEFHHITSLIENAKKQNKKVGIYPIVDDSWIDIGQWADYHKAVEQFDQ